MVVFWKAKGEPGFAGELSKELGEVEHLCWNFVSSAKTQKTQDRQKATYEELQGHAAEARRTLGEYKSGQDWTLGQVERLEAAFKVRVERRGGAAGLALTLLGLTLLQGLYAALQSHMNESESEVATSLAKNCGLLAVAATDMRDKQATHTAESLLHNVDQTAPVVLRSLRNRVQVTQDAEDRAALEGIVREIEAEEPRMREACRAFRAGQSSEQDKNRACNAVIRAAQRAQDILAKHIIGDASFKARARRRSLLSFFFSRAPLAAPRHRARGL